MATRAVRGEGPSAEDFNDLLFRGGELLGSGRVIESKDLLERAVSIDNRNEKALNLLGLAYFKLGMFDRASEIYEGLVRDNPADHTLRVNLGLVYLKSNALQRAIREFEVATDLSPGHAKAHNYLGLALAQVGEYGRARENFVAAGSDAMAEKMARALEEARAASPVAVVQPPSPPRPAAPMPQPEEVTIEVMDEAHTQLAESDWGTQVPGEPMAAPAPAAAPVEPPARVEAFTPIESPAPAPTAEDLRFAEDEGPSAPPMDQPIAVAPEKAEEPILLERKLAPPAEPEKPLFQVETSRPEKEAVEIAPPAVPELAAATFELVGEVLAVRVRDEVLLRTEGLIATSGTVTLTPEPKRFRGRPKDEPFGNGIARLMRAKGQGRVLIERAGRKFVAFDLKDESAYLREEVIFGFEEPIAFENGRLPSDEEPIELVHLRGEGQVLLRLPGALRSVRVRMEQPVTVALSSWVGWHGNVSPRVVALRPAEGGAKGPLAIELTGEGFALLSVPIG